MKDTGYTDEVLTVEHVSKLIPLYKSAFGESFNELEVRGKFFSAYQVKRASCVTTFNSDKAVSFYGMICQKAVYNGDVFYIGQSCDSMTHKEHGGKGLFVSLAGKVYKEIESKGVDYIYGFPNKTIYQLRINKLHWKHLENINYYKEKIRTLPFSKLVKKFPMLKSAYLTYIKRFLKRFKSEVSCFDNSVIGSDIGGVLHDGDYFEYKWTSDKFILRLENINFWVKIDGRLWVGDFERTTPEKFSKAFKILNKIAVFTGCTSIDFYYQEGSENDKLLKQFMGVEDTMPLGYLNLTEKHVGKQFKFGASDFDTW